MADTQKLTITDLEQKTEVTDNDNFAVDNGPTSYKVTAKQIKEYMAPTYVKKEGDTMTGPLHVPTPSSDTRDTSAPTTGWVQNKMDGKANADLSNGTKATQDSIDNIMPNTMDYVVESYSNESGNWYRVYKSGWVEQGGMSNTLGGSAKQTVTFLKPMSNANYSTNIASTPGGLYTGCGVSAKTSTSMSLLNSSQTSVKLSWFIIGQGAE